MNDKKEIIRLDSVNIYDKETIIPNCTVQILKKNICGRIK